MWSTDIFQLSSIRNCFVNHRDKGSLSPPKRPFLLCDPPSPHVMATVDVGDKADHSPPSSSRKRMSGAILLLPLYALMEWTGTRSVGQRTKVLCVCLQKAGTLRVTTRIRQRECGRHSQRSSCKCYRPTSSWTRTQTDRIWSASRRSRVSARGWRRCGSRTRGQGRRSTSTQGKWSLRVSYLCTMWWLSRECAWGRLLYGAVCVDGSWYWQLLDWDFRCSGVLLSVDWSIYQPQNVGNYLSTRATSPDFLGCLTFEDRTDNLSQNVIN